jgi:hypothetical protein
LWAGLSRNFVLNLDFRYDAITTGALRLIKSTVATLNQCLGGLGKPKLRNPD